MEEEDSCLIQSCNNVRLVKYDKIDNKENDCERIPPEVETPKGNEKPIDLSSVCRRKGSGIVAVNPVDNSKADEIISPTRDTDRVDITKDSSRTEDRVDVNPSENNEQRETDKMVEREEREGVEGETENRNNKRITRKRTIPPDGGWGWVVLAGSFVVMLLISSIGPCFSIVFSPLLLDLGTPPSTVFWIFSTFSLIWNLTSPAVGPLTKEFGYRRVAMVGSVLVTSGLIVSAFATSTWVLFLFFSLLGGIGAGVLVTISNLIIPVYFTKRLGRANGILMTGTSIGLFTAPYLITFLQECYTYLGATLILGGIFLNTIISAAVFQPVKWHNKTVDCLGNSSSRKEFQLRQGGSDGASSSSSGMDERHPSKAFPKEAKRKSVGICTILSRVCYSTVLSLRILCSPIAFIIALSGTLTMNGYLNFLIMVHFLVKNLHSSQASALCITVAGICNLVSRLIMSAMTDCKCFNKRFGYIVSISIIAITNLAFPFVTSLLWMTVTMGFWGYGVGSFMGLYNLVMIEYMGAKNLPAMFGSASLLNGLGFISIGPLLGFVTEISGSYSISIWVLASIECFCIVLWLLMPAAVSWHTRNLPHSLIGAV